VHMGVRPLPFFRIHQAFRAMHLQNDGQTDDVQHYSITTIIRHVGDPKQHLVRGGAQLRACDCGACSGISARLATRRKQFAVTWRG
jgi:hypothetical protein